MSGYDSVDALLDAEGFDETCHCCKFYDAWQEPHPYGEGTAYESLAECSCTHDEQCPRFNEQG